MGGMFEKFFGCIDPATFAPILSGFYFIVGLVFMILCFGRWIMPQAETDLAIPWAIICLLLMITGAYGLWASTKANTWHHRQFVSACWGFLLMFLCWSIVYIAVEDNHVDKVNTGCQLRNPTWGLKKCDTRRKTASLVAIIMVIIGMTVGIYFTLVLNNWVSKIEWQEHLENERKLEEWRSGKGENPHIKDQFEIEGRESTEVV